MPINPILALGAAASGTVASTFAAAVTAVGAGGDVSTLAPYMSGGGAVSAVAGLVYMARKLVNGDLVPRPVKEQEAELAAAIRAAAERETLMRATIEASTAAIRESNAVNESAARAIWAIGDLDRRKHPTRARPGATERRRTE